MRYVLLILITGLSARGFDSKEIVSSKGLMNVTLTTIERKLNEGPLVTERPICGSTVGMVHSGPKATKRIDTKDSLEAHQ